jgi:hypothetical protein
MYSPGIASPIFSESRLVGTVVDVVDVVDVVVVVVLVVVVLVVVVLVVVVLVVVVVVVVVVDVAAVVVVLDVVVVVLVELLEVVLDGGTEVVVAGVVVVVLDVLLEVVVVLSSVSRTEKSAFGSTTRTCGSRFKRFTSDASSSATKPFTLLENTSFTPLPSETSLLTLLATLAVSERITT